MWRKKNSRLSLLLFIYIKVEVIMYKSYFLFFCWKLLFIWLWENYLLKPSAWGNKNLLTAEEGEKKGLK